jgi:hypothetical protein
MLIVPNYKDRLVRWPNLYEGDYHFLAGVVKKGLPVFWWDRLIAIHHPCPDDPARR